VAEGQAQMITASPDRAVPEQAAEDRQTNPHEGNFKTKRGELK
jgi:hypothetical protein